MPYTAPLKDILFTVNSLANLAKITSLPSYEDATPETVTAVLEENAKFCEEIVAPLNAIGDKQPSYWHDGRVTTSPGFKAAFQAYGEAGWQGLQHSPDFGGQGLPKLVAAACLEMLNSAGMSFALCMLLTDSAIEALTLAGSEAQKNLYLAPLISGKWAGTMNLTEPQAGSDLAMVRTRAVAQPDGTYKLFGTKIFISYGEHDLAENILHLVLARASDAPPGVKGLSLFLVPKFLVNPDGTLGARNDVYCVSLEHKLGIKASPTAVLQFGDQSGAVSYLIGEPNRGLEYMFIMMNAARFAVGLQGIGIAERAYQKAVQYAKERIQSRDLAGSVAPVAIIQHPDVRRMLLMMRSQIEAARALAYVTAAASDTAHHHFDPTVQQENQAFYEFLVPIVKGWSTEMSVEVASLGIQVHGGMGYIEETGAAQHYRDARVLTIYEGTTAIQANDLTGRKTARDQGVTARTIISKIRTTLNELAASPDASLLAIHQSLAKGVAALEEVVDYICSMIQTDNKKVFAGSVAYLKLAGIVLGGWQMAKAALIAHQNLNKAETSPDDGFYQAKIDTARFFAEHLLSQATAYQSAITQGGSSIMALAENQF